MAATDLFQQKSNNIILIGMMGSGKTTVGKLLAKQLQKTFVDSDDEIQRRTGVTIPHIFDVEGEVGFRQRESAVIEELVMRQNIVLATGGGAPLHPISRELLKQNGVVIYLKSNVHDLWQRTRHDQSRPLLQTANPRASIQRLYEERDPIYSAMADIVIPTGKQNVQVLLAKLQDQLVVYLAKYGIQQEKS
ncbi:MAG: shikimate kinase [Sideroxydans sp.]|nr:shikimate kinase [Sideroxydans sp.]